MIGTRSESTPSGDSQLALPRLLLRADEVSGIQPEPVGDPLERAEGQVPFPPLEGAHVGAVNAKDVSEGLLGKLHRQPTLTQAPTDLSLNLTFHIGMVDDLLLIGLQPDQ